MSVGNNGSRMVGSTEFYGGLSTDNKIGIENSYADGECLDVRKSPSQMTVLPMARTLPDSGVITGLMTAMTQSKDGNIWGVDEDGKVYKIDENAGTFALESSFDVPYSSIVSNGSLCGAEGNWIVNSGVSKVFGEYDAEGRLIREFAYECDMQNYRTFKYDYTGFWFK